MSTDIYPSLFREFLANSDTLQVYHHKDRIFSSKKDRLLPLLEYIEKYAPDYEQVVIFDKIMGNAAALLSVKAGCCEVYSPLGSQLAVDTLNRYGIRYYLVEIIPYIQKPDGQQMCPMEELSLNKEPDEFYAIIKQNTP